VKEYTLTLSKATFTVMQTKHVISNPLFKSIFSFPVFNNSFLEYGRSYLGMGQFDKGYILI